MTKGYDPACEELARHFLPTETSERLIKELSQVIQDAVEDWISSEAERLTAELNPRQQ